MAAASLLAIAVSIPVLMCMLMPVASVAAVAALVVLAVATVMRVRMRVPASRAIMALVSLAITALLPRPCSIPPLSFHPSTCTSFSAHAIFGSVTAGWGTGGRHTGWGGRQGAWQTRPCPCGSLLKDTAAWQCLRIDLRLGTDRPHRHSLRQWLVELNDVNIPLTS